MTFPPCFSIFVLAIDDIACTSIVNVDFTSPTPSNLNLQFLPFKTPTFLSESIVMLLASSFLFQKYLKLHSISYRIV